MLLCQIIFGYILLSPIVILFGCIGIGIGILLIMLSLVFILGPIALIISLGVEFYQKNRRKV